MAISERELISIIKSEIDSSTAFVQGTLQEERRKSWQMFLADEKIVPNVKGKSSAVSTDLADMANAILASIMAPYGADSVADFEPDGDQDESQAMAESMACNRMLQERNQGYTELYQAIMDVLLFSNCAVKVWVEDELHTETQRLPEAPTKTAIKQLESASDGTAELVETDDGFELSLTTTRQVFMIRAIEQSLFHVDPDWPEPRLEGMRFIGERKLMTRSELLEQGFDKAKVEALPAVTMITDTDRIVKLKDQSTEPNQAETPDQDQIDVWEVYMLIDVDQDGFSERHRFVLAGEDTLLADEVWAGLVPYAIGLAFIIPHRFTGQSLYHKLKSVVTQKTKLLRQWLDNADKVNNAQLLAMLGGANLEDLSSQKPIVRVRTSDGVTQLVTADQGVSIRAALDYQDKRRAEAAGAALDMGAPEVQGGLKMIGAQSAAIQMTPMEQLSAQISRTISETLIRNIMLLIHDTLRRRWDGVINIRIAGQWQQVSPAQWRPREALNVKTGLTPSERSKKTQALQSVIQHQLGLMQGGGSGIMVTPNNIHRATMDWGKAQGIDSIDQYFTDPDSPQAQQAGQQQQQQQAQDKQTQISLMQAQLQIEAGKVTNDQQKNAIAAMQDQLQLQFDYWAKVVDAEIEEAKLVGQPTADLENIQSEGRSRSAATPGNGAATQS